MKIAGIYPQTTELDPKIQHAVSEPYGLEKILAIVKEEHETELFLPFGENSTKKINEEEFIENISDFEPDVACFSMYTCQYPSGVRIASELKKINSKIMIIGGNRYPTYLRDRIEEPFDFFVIGEGEITFKELIREMENGRNYGNVKGVAFRKNGKGVFTGNRKRNIDLDSLPDALRFPGILNQVYKGISIPPLSSNPHYAVVEYSRCCYNACKFCDNQGFWRTPVIFRSPEKVVDELSELKAKNIDIFYFMDLNFTAFHKKTIELCNEIKKRNMDISWYCMSNIATADDKDLLKTLKEAGCYKIAWGIESTSDKSLERMNKTTVEKLLTREKVLDVLEKSMDAGIINQGYYIIGFPWETEESILEDVKSLRYFPLHQLNIGIFTPIPLSRFYDEMQGEGYVFDPDLEKHDRNTLIYNHSSLTNKSIKSIQQQIHNDFYESPEYIERIRNSCTIDSRFVQAFNNYFEFLGKKVSV